MIFLEFLIFSFHTCRAQNWRFVAWEDTTELPLFFCDAFRLVSLFLKNYIYSYSSIFYNVVYLALFHLVCTVCPPSLQRRFDLCIPRNQTAQNIGRPIVGIYSMNLSQKHECRNWERESHRIQIQLDCEISF